MIVRRATTRRFLQYVGLVRRFEDDLNGRASSGWRASTPRTLADNAIAGGKPSIVPFRFTAELADRRRAGSTR